MITKDITRGREELFQQRICQTKSSATAIAITIKDSDSISMQSAVIHESSNIHTSFRHDFLPRKPRCLGNGHSPPDSLRHGSCKVHRHRNLWVPLNGLRGLLYCVSRFPRRNLPCSLRLLQSMHSCTRVHVVRSRKEEISFFTPQDAQGLTIWYWIGLFRLICPRIEAN